MDFDFDMIEERVQEAERNSKKLDKWRIENPWQSNCNGARDRCRNKNNKAYKHYGGKGIECLMSLDDFKFLWYRDGADDMDKATISRKDHKENYTIDNCCYMEWSEHIKMDKAKNLEE